MPATAQPQPRPKPIWKYEPTTIRVSALDGSFDFRLFHPDRNFGAGGLARTVAEIDRVYTDDTVVWQQEVYDVARATFERQQASRIVDFGAGAGTKFVNAFAGLTAERIQIDWDDRRETVASPESGEASRFLSANLEDPGDLDRVALDLSGGPRTIFLLSDVIEHLHDPRPLLRILRRLLREDEGNRLVISTPDRDLIDGAGSRRLPDNLGHVRQWTMNEFGLALLSAGFDVVRIGHVKQNQYDRHDRTVAAELACTDESYDYFLDQNHLPPRSDHVAITTEHGDALSTGGIGSYHLYSDEACGTRKVYLYTGASGLPSTWYDFVRERRWIHVALFTDRIRTQLEGLHDNRPDEILSALEHVIFLYDEIRLVEYQDYLGIGMRVAQAKRAGLLPPSITVCAYAHGNHFYLDSASGGLCDVGRSLELDTRERIALEEADVVLFPSRFLRDLYHDAQGLRFRKAIHQAYPIQFKRAAVSEQMRRPIDTLLFYGKQTPQKGYPEFCDAVVELFGDGDYADVSAQIKRVVLLGVTQPDPRLFALSDVEVVHGVYPLEEVIAVLIAHSPHALAVLPYKGDNHPLSVFEVVDADCQILAFDIGGVPEILPASLHDKLLCAPKAKALAAAMARAAKQTFWDRTILLNDTFRLMQERYEAITRDYKTTIDALKEVDLPPRPPRQPVSVIVPNLNGEKRFFDDLAVGLRNSFFKPTRVHLVDDGSDRQGIERLEEGVSKLGDIPHDVTVNARNLGLAGARNAGLEKVETPYVCAHDNDNILLNRYLDVACRILDENPEVAVVTAWSWGWRDGSSWRARRKTWDYEYRPLGQDLGAMLRFNAIGDAFAVYRTQAIRDVGGWDGSSKALWEDWQLFTRMTVAGMKIWVIPHPMFLYRLRRDSMLQTYARMPGELRMVRTLAGLKPADALSLITTLRKFEKDVSSIRERSEREFLARRESEMRAIAERSRMHLAAEAQVAEERRERLKAVAHLANSQLSFENAQARGQSYFEERYADAVRHAEASLGEERRERLRVVARFSASQLANEMERDNLHQHASYLLFVARRDHLLTIARQARERLALEIAHAILLKRQENVRGTGVENGDVGGGRPERTRLVPAWLAPLSKMLLGSRKSRQEEHVPTEADSLEYRNDRRLVEISGLFDADWYLQTYADLVGMKETPLDHYMLFGGFEGRSPGPLFNGAFYLNEYKDVAESGLHPLVHFLRFGAEEGRLPGPPPAIR